MIVDLSQLRRVEVQSGAIVACQGGATWRDFDTATSMRGLALTGGTVSSTGVAGLTLGGGIGWLLPSAGLACDSLIGADVVMADGSSRHVRDDSDSELMKHLRGFGHGLLIATKLYFRAHPLGKIVGGSIKMDLRGCDDLSLEFIAGTMTNPPESLMLSPSLIFQGERAILSLDLAFHRPSPGALIVLEKLERLKGVVRTTVRERSYSSLQTMLDEPSRKGLRSYWRHTYLRSIEASQIAQVSDAFQRAPSDRSLVFFEHYHGAYLVPPHASAFPNRNEVFSLLSIACWSSPAGDESSLEWLATLDRTVRPWRNPGPPYINYASDLEEGAPWIQSYAKVKQRVDPEDVLVDARPHSIDYFGRNRGSDE